MELVWGREMDPARLRIQWRQRRKEPDRAQGRDLHCYRLRPAASPGLRRDGIMSGLLVSAGLLPDRPCAFQTECLTSGREDTLCERLGPGGA